MQEATTTLGYLAGPCSKCKGSGTQPSGIVSPVLGPVPMACDRCRGDGREPVLESVDDHNARRKQERAAAQEKLRYTGVACPKCGKELLWFSGPFFVPTPWLHQTRAAQCLPCALTVELET